MIHNTKFFDEIGLPVKGPIHINANNNGAISNSLNNKNHRHTKHIDVRHYFIKDCVAHGQVAFHYVPSSENLADILTKSLPKDATRKFTTYLNLVPNRESVLIQGEYCSRTSTCEDKESITSAVD